MKAWEISNERIYQLLKHKPQGDKSLVFDLESAYADFVENLFDFLNKADDKKQAIRILELM